MNIERGLIIGLDYRDQDAVISYYNMTTHEPVTLPAEEKIIGLKAVFKLLQKEIPNSFIHQIAVTVENPTREFLLQMREELKQNQIPPENVYLHGHYNSYLYYALGQKEEFVKNNIGLFDFNVNGMRYYQIELNKRKEPYRARLYCLSLEESFGPEVFQEICSSDDKEVLQQYDTLFTEAVTEIFQKSIVSTVYFTGAGFEKNWSRATFNRICTTHKAFLGQNLYSQGACMAAAVFSGVRKFDHIQLIGGDAIHYDIGIKCQEQGGVHRVILKEAGSLWLEEIPEVSVILDDTEVLDLWFRSKVTHGETMECIKLLDLPQRENKTIRLRLKIEMNSVDHMTVTIIDEGFGMIHSPSGLAWQKNIQLPEQF